MLILSQENALRYREIILGGVAEFGVQNNRVVPHPNFYEKDNLPLKRYAIQTGYDTDASGSFIAWLRKQASIYAYPMPSKRWDIGNLERDEQVKLSMPVSI